MESRISTRDEFLQRYWNYYIMLEKDFLDVEQYLTIDEVNFNSFSNEYIKQYQIICSEIDVISKSYCKEIDNHFNGSTINTYCKCITDNNTDFSNRIIKVNKKDFKVTPWKNWNYSITQNNGKSRIEVNNPEWWKKYNKIKHCRTTINNETRLPYYKLANQKNVLNALAALFQLEMYYYRLLCQNRFPQEPDMPGSSNLFSIENWGNRSIFVGTEMWVETE